MGAPVAILHYLAYGSRHLAVGTKFPHENAEAWEPRVGQFLD